MLEHNDTFYNRMVGPNYFGFRNIPIFVRAMQKVTLSCHIFKSYKLWTWKGTFMFLTACDQNDLLKQDSPTG